MRIIMAILGIIVLLPLVLTALNIRSIRRSKRVVREYFASASMILSLLIFLLALLIVIPHIGYLDIILAWSGNIDGSVGTLSNRTFGLMIATVFSAVAIFSNLFMSVRTHKYWDGVKSVRQVRLGSHGNWNNVFGQAPLIFLADACIGMFRNKYRHELKIHRQKNPGEVVFGDGETIPPWHQEFAAIYQILDPRVSITEKNHWYAENNCYVFPFDKEQYVAALVCDTMPNEDKQEVFLRFLNRLGYKYFRVIIAVKDNPDGQNTMSIQKNDYDITIDFKDRLLDKFVNFNDYFEKLKDRMNEKINPDSNYTLNDVYTPLYFYNSKTRDKYNGRFVKTIFYFFKKSSAPNTFIE